jgi:hypothetical protein
MIVNLAVHGFFPQSLVIANDVANDANEHAGLMPAFITNLD